MFQDERTNEAILMISPQNNRGEYPNVIVKTNRNQLNSKTESVLLVLDIANNQIS